MYLVSLWAGYITSPGSHERLLWQSSRPSRWHPQHMWHDLLQHGYTGAQSHCANSRQGPQMCVDPLGHGSRMRCPSLCGSADAPHNCQAFSFIRPRSDTYRGVLPEAITAASLRCGHTHIHTQTQSHLESFLKGANFISGKMWWRGISFFFSVLCFEYVQGRGDKNPCDMKESVNVHEYRNLLMNTERKFVSSLTKSWWKPVTWECHSSLYILG